MNKIVRKEQFSEKVFLFEIEAPLIAKSRKAGNFVIVRVDKKGERMPLTIAGADIERGTITLVVQMVGLSSKKLCALKMSASRAALYCSSLSSGRRKTPLRPSVLCIS